MKWTLLLAVLVIVSCIAWSCKSSPSANEKSNELAQSVLMKAMHAHGSHFLSRARLTFTFRDYLYTMKREEGQYQYERQFTDTSGHTIRDVLSNDGFVRYIDGVETTIAEERASAYSNSVNSVIYFATLPFSLNDPAVQPEYLGEAEVNGESYHKVKITFRQEGGGKDFEDEFVYWIGKEDHLIDYLAYSYQTDGGGARFREAYNERIIEGVRFVDYRNFKPVEPSMAVAHFDSLFVLGGLKEVSLIETENIHLVVDGE